jgi:hypothetical protein
LRKFRNKKIISSETGGMYWHHLLEKQVKRDKKMQPIKNRVQSVD